MVVKIEMLSPVQGIKMSVALDVDCMRSIRGSSETDKIKAEVEV